MSETVDCYRTLIPRHDYRPVGDGVHRCSRCGRTITVTVEHFEADGAVRQDLDGRRGA